MHLCQCGSSFNLGTSLEEPLHASCSVWIITLFGSQARRAITHILLSVDHYFLWKKARRAIKYILLSVDHYFLWETAKRAFTCISVSVDHRFILVQG
jgi:hypothetical protein